MKGWDQLQDIGRIVRVDMEEAIRQDVGSRMRKLKDSFHRRARVKTGRFRASLESYRGSRPHNEGKPAGRPFYEPSGHEEVDAVMSGWRIGEEVGQVDQVPYSEVLAARPDASGAEGWLDIIAEEVARG